MAVALRLNTFTIRGDDGTEQSTANTIKYSARVSFVPTITNKAIVDNRLCCQKRNTNIKKISDYHLHQSGQ